jgi:acyl-CoA-binding protein
VGEECALRCRLLEFEHPTEITREQSLECGREVAAIARDRASHYDEMKHTHEHGVECAHACADKAKQLAHAHGTDPIEVTSDTVAAKEDEHTVDRLCASLTSLENTFLAAAFWIDHRSGNSNDTDSSRVRALRLQATHGDVCNCDRPLKTAHDEQCAAWRRLKGMDRAQAMQLYIDECAMRDAKWMTNICALLATQHGTDAAVPTTTTA